MVGLYAPSIADRDQGINRAAFRRLKDEDLGKSYTAQTDLAQNIRKARSM